jgi:hypothetical protein
MSFAARLQKAIDVLTLLLGFTGFNPPADFALDKFKELIVKVTNANNDVQAKIQAYRKAVATRANIFRNDADSVLLKLTKLNGAVIAAYGRNSHPHNMIRDLIRRLRLTRIVVTPPDPTTDTAEKKVTLSDRGYGAMLGHYRNIIEAIKTFPDWDAKMPDMKIADLQKAVDDAQQANVTVMETYGARSAALKARKDLYVELRDFVLRMKGYVRSKYGPGREDDLIKSVRI